MKNRIMISALCICTLLTASGCDIGAESEAPIGYHRESDAATISDQGEQTESSLGKPSVQEAAPNNAQIQLADIVGQCRVWERRYGEDNTLPVEIFLDLQNYVARGECAEALSAYRQEELICTVEELQEVCPEFETLVDQYLKREYRETHFEANKIYRLEAADDKPCFLLFYRCLDTDREGSSFLSTMLLKEGEEGWRIINNSSGASGGVDDYEVFAGEQAGRKVYYLLKGHNMESSFAWLQLARLSEIFDVPIGGWSVRLIKTGVRPEFLFQETESELISKVRAYVEDNLWFLAWMQQNGEPIWGDEDAQTHSEMREAVDFGGADTGSKQIWLIDFDGRPVTFQLVETEDGAIALEAYDHEGNSGSTLLLSCRICFIQEAGVDWFTPAYFEAFDFNGLTIRNTEDIWFRNEVQEQAWKEQQQRNIVPWQGETPFSEELYRLLREEAWTGLYGEENSLLESYRLDLTEDTEIFMQKAAETDRSKSLGVHSGDRECKWVYRWLEDGSENFLSCINYNYAKDSIQWWKTGEGGLEEYDYVMEYRDPSQMICCGGRFYCMSEAVPEYRGGDVYVNIMEIGDSENWRTSAFSIRTRSFDDQELACIPLYEEEGLSSEVKDYVQEWYEEIGEACIGRISLFPGMEEEKELTAEENRILNSLSDGSKDMYSNHRYFSADIDNDGIVEYGHADYRGYLEVTFYEKENGEFRVIPLEEVILDQNIRKDSLVETSLLLQLWCEKMGDTTYLFTVEGMAYSPDYILRIRVIKDDYVEDKAVYLLKADMEEYCQEWDILEIMPTADGVG